MTGSAKAALSLFVLFLALPLAYSCWRRAREGSDTQPAWDWRLNLKSTLAFALAFNLIFFIQEIFLVLPKALTPGLEPTPFHNNHHRRAPDSKRRDRSAAASVGGPSIAAAWIPAAAWHAGPINAGAVQPRSIVLLLIALGALLVFFQLVLRRGIDFF